MGDPDPIVGLYRPSLSALYNPLLVLKTLFDAIFCMTPPSYLLGSSIVCFFNLSTNWKKDIVKQ